MNHSRAVVTGGGSGIGKAISLALAREGARVAIVDVDETAALQVMEEIRAHQGEALALRASVSEPDELARAFSEIDAAWDGVDILVNNAGIGGNKPALELASDEWRRIIDINLNGVFYGSQQAAARMKRQGSGSIVNIGSIYSLVAAPNRSAYCAAKAGVAMLTKSLAIEWADLGIRVNAVAPGYVHTQLTREMVDQGRLDLNIVAKRTPFGRLAEPAEIADAVLFLVSDKAAFITGQILAVDGGWTAYGYV